MRTCNANLLFSTTRTITVKDAMSDLPPIKNGASKPKLSYGSEAQSHFQRVMRTREIEANLKELAKAACHGDEIELKASQASRRALRDHICKNLAPLIEMRMAYVPLEPGSDWRDLPNIVVQLKVSCFCSAEIQPAKRKSVNLIISELADQMASNVLLY